MRFASLLPIALLTTALAAHADPPVKHKTTTAKSSTHPTTQHVASHGKSRASHTKSAHKSTMARAPMGTERATQIQTALIKSGYLSGEPTGTWDAQSMAAMQKLQSDNGWQTKIVPDSRALIKLGLGPQSPN
jgi:peptidoglycan hydrolase-like protein with peptidoglycan-binding domain